MKESLLNLLVFLAFWSLASVAVGMVIARVLALASARSSESLEGVSECTTTIEPSEWPDEALSGLYAAISEPEFIESVLSDLAELEVYEGRERS